MTFENSPINKSNYKILIKDVNAQKIPHGQLFYGDHIFGTLPTALLYAKYIFCETEKKLDLPCLSCGNCKKMDLLIHPDLHFIFPTAAPPKNPVSSDFMESWKKLILNSKNICFQDWQDTFSGNNKKLIINTHEVDIINSVLKKKSYQGGYKIFIIWCAEKLNKEASNKLLKNLEEPPEKTIFILISDNKDKLLSTLLSRLRTISFNTYSQNVFEKNINRDIDISLC